MAEPASRPTDARQVRSRRQLSEALLRLLECRPFDQVTIREIASEAGIGYATFFRHYRTKEALLHDVAASQIAALLDQAFPILLAQDSRQSCIALLEYVARHRALWLALLTGGAAAILKQEFTDQARHIARHHGTGNRRIPDELRAVVAVGATVEIIAWWLQQDQPDDLPRVAEILDRLVVVPAIAPD